MRGAQTCGRFASPATRAGCHREVLRRAAPSKPKACWNPKPVTRGTRGPSLALRMTGGTRGPPRSVSNPAGTAGPTRATRRHSRRYAVPMTPLLLSTDELLRGRLGPDEDSARATRLLPRLLLTLVVFGVL